MTATALKIALRETRASWTKFAFVILAVAVGVGSLVGVRGFSSSFESMLLREARSLMAADVSVRLFAQPTAEQQAAVDSLAQRGVDYTRITETLSMVTAEGSPDPILSSVKAVDPAKFPFYGIVKLDNGSTLRDALSPNDTAVVSTDLRARLNINTGDTLRIGGEAFRIAGVVLEEPDRMSGSLNVGPRLMVSRTGLERAGLMTIGSRGAQRFLFQLGPGAPGVAVVQRELRRAFPEAMIVDFRELNPNIERGLQRATTFLSLVSLIALIVGALGVATAMHAHLQTRMDGIAIMKSIGARSNQVIRIYVIQTLLLGVAGGIAGVLVGSVVQLIFPELIHRYFQMRPDVFFTPSAAAQGMLIGLLTTLLFTLPPLLSVRHIRPALIFRRDMAEVRPGWRQRLRQSALSLVAGVVICLGLGVIAAWLIGTKQANAGQIAMTFIGGLIASLLILAGVASILLKVLQLFVRSASSKLPVTTRHAVANLYRPGSQSRAVLTALGIGVMFTLTVYLLQHNVLAEIQRTAPAGMPNVFLLDITPEQKDTVVDLIRKHPGVERPPDILSTVSCRLVSIDGVSADKLRTRDRRYRMARAITEAAEQPEGVIVTRGKWWSGTPETPQLAVTGSAARNLKLEPGTTVVWNAFGRNIETKVAAVYRSESERLRNFVEFTMSPGALEGLPTVYYGAARVRTENIAPMQRALYQRFPTVTVVNVADILDRVQEVVDQIAVVIRFISAFAILAGAVILASSVAGTRFRRVREVVIFKTLGATRKRIASMFSTEFLIIGTVAGVMGSLLATVFTYILLAQFFKEAPFDFAVLPNLVSVALTALIASAAGWLASFRILGQKPLEVLRGE